MKNIITCFVIASIVVGLYLFYSADKRRWTPKDKKEFLEMLKHENILPRDDHYDLFKACVLTKIQNKLSPDEAGRLLKNNAKFHKIIKECLDEGLGTKGNWTSVAKKMLLKDLSSAGAKNQECSDCFIDVIEKTYSPVEYATDFDKVMENAKSILIKECAGKCK